MLLAPQPFPFVNMNVAGVTSEVTLQIPGVMFLKITPASAFFYYLFQLVPGILLVTILLLSSRASLPLSVKKRWRGLFLPSNRIGEWRKYFSPGCWSSFVKLMTTAISASAAVLFRVLIFVSFKLRAFRVVIVAAGLWDDIALQPALAQPLTPRDYRYPGSLCAFLRLLCSDPACGGLVCPRRHEGYVRRKTVCSGRWRCVPRSCFICANIYFADYDY